MTRRAVAVAAVGAILLTQSVRLGAEDRIRLRGVRQRQSGTITAETQTEVVLKKGRREKKIAVNEIERVNYNKEPRGISQARINEQSGQRLKDVLDAYRKGYEEVATLALKDTKTDFSNLKRNLRFAEARVLARLAVAANDEQMADEAIEMLTRFAEKNPKSRYHFPLHSHLAKLYLLKGDAEAARKALAVVAGCPFPEWRLAAHIDLARIDMSRGDYDKALEALSRIISQTSSTDDEKLKAQRQAATIQKARCLVAKKEFEQAAKFLNEAIGKTPQENRQSRAEGYGALGDCYLAQNKAEKALLQYLRVIVLYPDVREQRARALYFAAKCWDELREDKKAAKLRQELALQYPNSTWNKKQRSE